MSWWQLIRYTTHSRWIYHQVFLATMQQRRFRWERCQAVKWKWIGKWWRMSFCRKWRKNGIKKIRTLIFSAPTWLLLTSTNEYYVSQWKRIQFDASVSWVLMHLRLPCLREMFHFYRIKFESRSHWVNWTGFWNVFHKLRSLEDLDAENDKWADESSWNKNCYWNNIQRGIQLQSVSLTSPLFCTRFLKFP